MHFLCFAVSSELALAYIIRLKHVKTMNALMRLMRKIERDKKVLDGSKGAFRLWTGDFL